MTVSRGGTSAVTGLEAIALGIRCTMAAVDNIADWLFESEGTADYLFFYLKQLSQNTETRYDRI